MCFQKEYRDFLMFLPDENFCDERNFKKG